MGETTERTASALTREGMFRAVVETAHDAIFFTDSSGSVVFWNRTAEVMFGYDAVEMEGKPLTLIVPRRLRAAHEKGIRAALSGNLPVSGKTTEITGLRKDGGEFPLELTLSTWEKGEETFLAAIARDVTERQVAQGRLAESEERYRKLFEESPIALWEKDCGSLMDRLDELRRQGVTDFRRWFEGRPDAVFDLLGLIRVVDVNMAAVQMYGGATKEELFSGLRNMLCGESAGMCRDALLSHSTDLSDEEIRIIADTGTHVVHNPSAVASIRGRCPVPELLDAGASVVLGSDATAPDRSGDMFRHMQQCMHYHRRHFRDPDVLPPGKVLEMVTIDAARALGLDNEIGSIEAGKKADVILVDLFKPHTYPFQMPLYRTIYFANGNDVDTVIVDGRILMRHREVLSVDERTVLEAAQKEADLALERSGLTGLTNPRPRLWGHSHY